MSRDVDLREGDAQQLDFPDACSLVAPSRLLMQSQLRDKPATVSEITAALDMEQSGISHQLRLLRMMGLVTASRSGRRVTYALFDHHVASLLDEAVYHAEHLRLGVPDQDVGAVAT